MHDTILHTEPEKDPDGLGRAPLELEIRVAAPPSPLRPDISLRVFSSVLQMLPNGENPSAELQGQVGHGRGLVEPTSGNTGISAMAQARGYGMRAIVPNKVPLEKKVLLKIVGAELDVMNDALCPAPGLGDGSINLARTHAKASLDRYVMPNQYENPKNVEAHYQTTGPEIWRQTERQVTHVFASLGTCGTITGISRFLREKKPEVKIIAVQPTEGHDVPGLRNLCQLEVSKLFDRSLIDDILEIDYDGTFIDALQTRQCGAFSRMVFACG